MKKLNAQKEQETAVRHYVLSTVNTTLV